MLVQRLSEPSASWAETKINKKTFETQRQSPKLSVKVSESRRSGKIRKCLFRSSFLLSKFHGRSDGDEADLP